MESLPLKYLLISKNLVIFGNPQKCGYLAYYVYTDENLPNLMVEK